MDDQIRRAYYGDPDSLRDSANKFFTVISQDLFVNMLHVCDFGCGDGFNTQWWCDQAPYDDADPYANHTKVSGIDLIDSKTDKFDRTQGDILSMPYKDDEFNLGWCHYTLQQLKDPVLGLIEMKRVMTDYSLLFVTVPQPLDTEYNRLKTKFSQFDRVFYTLPILITHLAMAGWDCRGGYFLKEENNRDIFAVVKPMREWKAPNDPYELNMYDLMDRKVLPESTDDMIKSKGYFDETVLLLKWMNGMLTDYNTRV